MGSTNGVVPVYDGDGSDYGGLFTGDEGSKSGPEAAAFGGTPGDKYDSCHHRSCDTLGNVDPEVLETMADALTHATLAWCRAGTDD
ncbi:MAG: hypothetical protein ABWX68_11800 [Arthrobacter sp.]|uniref:hypothetical protein n=1 Tax=Arthrobacter sp. TaxID=1667 RepID=UPI0034856ABE